MRYRYDLTGFIDKLFGWLDAHHLGTSGAYVRRTHGSPPDMATPPDAYGCADAANILYTIGSFPGDPAEREQWVAQLQSFQDPLTGSFQDKTHSKYHTTAHCVAALELFDARPRHPLTFLSPLLDRAELERFLDSLDWQQPWPASHNGAGCAAALAIMGEASYEWRDWYFDWLDANVDPETGFWRRGHMLPGTDNPGFFSNLGASFHYHFNYTYFREPIPYPEKVIDSCLLLLESSAVSFAIESVGFKEIDWIYCINRALQQCGHRQDEVRKALSEMCDRVVALLGNADLSRNEFDDVHTMFGAVCALAELQQALPGVLRTPHPLKLVLDRRPFI